MPFIVNQISKGQVVDDYDERLTPKDELELLEKYLGNLDYVDGITRNKIPVFNNTAIFFAQITYLGKPHPVYKKRIQIKKYWIDEYRHFKEKGYKVVFIGIYKYRDTTFFVDFNTQYYVENKANNSSAHVMINDLYQASIYGTFSKRDRSNNEIVVISSDLFKDYLTDSLVQNESSSVQLFKDFNKEFLKDERINALDAVKEMYYSKPLIPYMDCWRGFYPNTFQGEWAGFYLEYRFCKYLNENNLFDQVLIHKDKEHSFDLDFDLAFIGTDGISFYGDLKASDWQKLEAPGNDKSTVLEAINRYNKFWYVIYEHRKFVDNNLKQ